MYQHFSALFRSSAHNAAEAIVDANASTILRQHIKDGALNIAQARKAVATTIALQEEEQEHHKKLMLQIKDLENRAKEAIAKNKLELATEAAEAIAILEDEMKTSSQTQRRIAEEISYLKGNLREAQAKLRDLQRREKLALANERSQKIQPAVSSRASRPLQDAETTLERMEKRQKQTQRERRAEKLLAQEGDKSGLSERLAEAGCGEPTKSSAEIILNRLQSDVQKSKK